MNEQDDETKPTVTEAKLTLKDCTEFAQLTDRSGRRLMRGQFRIGLVIDRTGLDMTEHAIRRRLLVELLSAVKQIIENTECLPKEEKAIIAPFTIINGDKLP